MPNNPLNNHKINFKEIKQPWDEVTLAVFQLDRIISVNKIIYFSAFCIVENHKTFNSAEFSSSIIFNWKEVKWSNTSKSMSSGEVFRWQTLITLLKNIILRALHKIITNNIIKNIKLMERYRDETILIILRF